MKKKNNKIEENEPFTLAGLDLKVSLKALFEHGHEGCVRAAFNLPFKDSHKLNLCFVP